MKAFSFRNVLTGTTASLDIPANGEAPVFVIARLKPSLAFFVNFPARFSAAGKEGPAIFTQKDFAIEALRLVPVRQWRGAAVVPAILEFSGDEMTVRLPDDFVNDTWKPERPQNFLVPNIKGGDAAIIPVPDNGMVELYAVKRGGDWLYALPDRFDDEPHPLSMPALFVNGIEAGRAINDVAKEHRAACRAVPVIVELSETERRWTVRPAARAAN